MLRPFRRLGWAWSKPRLGQVGVGDRTRRGAAQRSPPCAGVFPLHLLLASRYAGTGFVCGLGCTRMSATTSFCHVGTVLIALQIRFFSSSVLTVPMMYSLP